MRSICPPPVGSQPKRGTLMPAKLHSPVEFVKLRLLEADMDLLRAVHGHGKVNEVIRTVMSAYCARVRGKLAGVPPNTPT